MYINYMPVFLIQLECRYDILCYSEFNNVQVQTIIIVSALSLRVVVRGCPLIVKQV